MGTDPVMLVNLIVIYMCDDRTFMRMWVENQENEFEHRGSWWVERIHTQDY